MNNKKASELAVKFMNDCIYDTVLDETECVKGAYPQIQNAIEKIAKKL